jgi:hypothetical protein
MKARRPIQLTTLALAATGLLLVAPATGASGASGERASDQASARGDKDGIVIRDGSDAEPFVANVAEQPNSPSPNPGGGFDWGDAAIGAAIGACGTLALAGATIGLRRRRSGMSARPASAASVR